MNITCPKCKAVCRFDEADYIPGSTNTEECWRCGEELTFTIPGDTSAEGQKEVAVSKVHTPAKSAEGTTVHHATVAMPVANNENAELEKARLALEAERIRLEHRKMDHELEMNQRTQQRAIDYDAYDEDVVKPRKDKTTAGLLAILLGGIGAHKFYLGKTGQGILYLIFCWTYIPGIIGLIEGIKYLTKNERDFHENCY